MKNPSSNSNPEWEKLLRQARSDVGPPVDSAALIRAVRKAAAALPPTTGWLTEFSTLFSSARILSGCLAGAGSLLAIAMWQAWDAWQLLPWAQLLDAAVGGAS